MARKKATKKVARTKAQMATDNDAIAAKLLRPIGKAVKFGSSGGSVLETVES